MSLRERQAAAEMLGRAEIAAALYCAATPPALDETGEVVYRRALATIEAAYTVRAADAFAGHEPMNQPLLRWLRELDNFTLPQLRAAVAKNTEAPFLSSYLQLANLSRRYAAEDGKL